MQPNGNDILLALVLCLTFYKSLQTSLAHIIELKKLDRKITTTTSEITEEVI